MLDGLMFNGLMLDDLDSPDGNMRLLYMLSIDLESSLCLVAA